MLKFAFIAVVMAMAYSPISHATQDVNGNWTLGYAHEHFSYVFLQGDAAAKLYDNLKVQETPGKNGDGAANGSFDKNTVDGRMWCQRIPKNATGYLPSVQGTTMCTMAIDSSSGEMDAPWAPKKEEPKHFWQK